MFRRILIIFVVGFLSRSLVNMVFEINVFKDYMNCISLIYYGLMAVFTSYVYELPCISFNVFNLNFIRSGFKGFFGGLFSDKMYLGDSMFIDNMSSKNTRFDSKNEISRHIIKSRPSAGIIGLYYDGGDGHRVSSKVGNRGDNSFGNNFKSRLYWFCWKQFSKDFGSYNEFVAQNSSSKFSIRKEIKKDIVKKLNK